MTDRLIPPDALNDDVITLRPFRPEDARAIAAAGDDPEVARWTPFPSPYTVGQVREWIARQPAADAVDLVITDAVDGTVLGWVGLHDLDSAQRRAELGIWLGAAARGQGHAVRAIRLITAWGFAELGLVRIAALCLAGNAVGQRAMRSAGFVHEGVLAAYEEVKGVRHDTAVLGMVTPPSPLTSVFRTLLT